MPIDKDQLYDRFHKSWERRERLADLATRKALDLPAEDDVRITTNTTHQGSSLLATSLVSMALLLAGGAAALGLTYFKSSPAQPPSTTTIPPSPQQFKVSFWGEDDKEIQVEKNGAARTKQR